MSDARRLAELGMVPVLARELAAQITVGTGDVRRLVELTMVPRLAREVVTQINSKIVDARRLAELSMAPRLASEVVTQISGLIIPIAPVEDQPIVTAASGNSVIAGQVAHTATRTTPGDNTTPVDVNNDPKFRYPGIPAGKLIPSGASIQQPFCDIIPGGLSQVRRWDFQIEFVTSSQRVAYVFAGDPSPKFIVVVNGKWISLPFQVSVISGESNITLEFPDSRDRKIKIITGGFVRMIRVNTENGKPPVRSASAGKILLCIGDSLSAGANGVSSLETWPQAAASMLGFDHCCNAAIGGTKWVQSGTGDAGVSQFGGDRLPVALTINPEAVVFAGSRNDAGGNQTQLDSITAAVSAALDSTPIVKRFVSGTFTVLPQNSAVKIGANARSVPFIDMQDGLQPEDISGDLVHPTLQGAINLRDRFAPRLKAAGCVP